LYPILSTGQSGVWDGVMYRQHRGHVIKGPFSTGRAPIGNAKLGLSYGHLVAHPITFSPLEGHSLRHVIELSCSRGHSLFHHSLWHEGAL
jgi:hypothetical protein